MTPSGDEAGFFICACDVSKLSKSLAAMRLCGVRYGVNR